MDQQDPRPAAIARVAILSGILKAHGVPELVEIATVEVGLQRSLLQAHFAAARKSIAASVAVVAKVAKPTTVTVARAIQAARDVYQKTFLPAAKAATDDAIPIFYQNGKIAGWKKVTGKIRGDLRYEIGDAIQKGTGKGTAFTMVKPAFDVKDEDAIETLKGQQVFWIGDHYDENLAKTISKTARTTILETGIGGAEAAKVLEQRLLLDHGLAAPDSWKGTTPAYMKMVASNAATTGRVFGTTRAFQQFGVSRLVIWNPLDEVTCERCGLMNGKTISTEAASAQMAGVLGAKTKAGVKAAHPWHPISTWKKIGMAKGPGAIKGSLESKLLGLGISLPPFHGDCRCSVDIAEDATIQPLPEQPEWSPPPTIEVPAVPEIPIFEPPVVEPEPIPEPPGPTLVPEPVEPAPPPVPESAIPVTVVDPAAPIPAETPFVPPKKPKVPKKPKAPAAQPPVEVPATPPALDTLPPHRQAFPWRESDLKTRSDIRLGGAHAKQVYESPDGTLWMFKPVQAGEDFLAHTEKAMSDLALDMDLPAVEIHVVRIEGKTGSIHRMFPNVAGDYKNVALSTVKDDEFDQLMANHVVNWLIGDNDSHVENFLRLKDGRVIGIDHGQAFKFYRTDDLHNLGYNPNQGFHSGTVVNKLLKAYVNGDFGTRELPTTLDRLPRTKALIDRLLAVPDDQMLRYVEAYTAGAHRLKQGAFAIGPGKTAWTRANFNAAFLQRRNALRSDFEKLLKNVQRMRGPLRPFKAPDVVTPLDAAWMDKVRKAKGNGRSLFIGGSDFEDMHLVVTPTKNDGVFASGKLRKDAGDKLTAKLNAILRDRPAAASVPVPTGPISGTDSPKYQQALTIVKSFKAHLSPGHKIYDGIVPEKTKDAAQTLLDNCAEAMKKFPAGSLEHAEAAHYKAAIETFANTGKDGLITGWKTNDVGGVFVKPWQVPKAKPIKAPKTEVPSASSSGSSGARYAKIDWGSVSKSYSDGEVVVDSKRKWEAWRIGSRNAYEIDVGNGVKIRYRPHESKTAEYAEQGAIEIHVDRKAVGEVTEREIQQALDVLNELGVETRLATQTDLDVMYLRKVSHVSGAESDRAFKAISETDPASAQVAALKKFWNKRQPGFEETAAWKNRLVWDTEEHDGHPRWMRFDVAEDLEKAAADGYHLGHAIGFCQSLTRDQKIDRICQMIKGTQGLAGTEERLRLGIQTPRSITAIGGSAESDRHTGGAAYAFTRVRSSPSATDDLAFHIDLAADANSVSYKYDEFGKVFPSTYAERVNQTVDGIKGAASYSQNETNFKYRVGIARWLKEIRVKSAAEKKKVLQAFSEAGIAHCRGVPVEKIVVLRK